MNCNVDAGFHQSRNKTQSGKLLLTPQDYITQVLYFFNQFACIYDWSIGAGARDSVAGYNFCRVWC
jgi:hypothetical protein